MQYRCRGCEAPIVWMTTPKGKKVPCDAYPVSYTVGGKDPVVTPSGEIVRATIRPEQPGVTRRGYRPHWATCPKGYAFSASGRGRRR